MRTIIADTSGILVVLDAGAAEHAAAHAAIADAMLVISPLVLAEIDYKISTSVKAGGTPAALAFAGDVRDGTYTLASWDNNDHALAVDVATTYQDMSIGLADASNVVLAQRYGTTRILTLDGHFRAVKPLGGEHFVMLPADE